MNPFGITLPEAAAAAAEIEDTILFAGDFRHPPNVDAALWLTGHIFPAVLARRPAARLTLVGGTPPRSVRGLASRNIEVTGRVPAIAPYLARAAVVVAPLRTGGGMRLKVIEAMAAGRAIVATPLAAEGVEEAAGAGAVVIAGDAGELASAISTLLADRAARQSIGRRAREWVARNRTREASAERLTALYRELLAEHEPERRSGRLAG